MKIEFYRQVPKDLSYPDDNEDAYRVDEGRSLIALCDGASESFASKTWATILANKFINEQVIDQVWIAEAISSYNEQFDCQEMSWFSQEAFKRGSFSTFLGVVYSALDERVEITGIGDSIALLAHDKEIIDSFPYKSVEEFQKRPELLSTISEHNRFLFSEDGISRRKKVWSIDKNQPSNLLLMTDALAEWTLKDGQVGNTSLKKLLQVGCDSDFEELILSERNAKNIRIDDTTLIKVTFDGK